MSNHKGSSNVLEYVKAQFEKYKLSHTLLESVDKVPVVLFHRAPAPFTTEGPDSDLVIEMGEDGREYVLPLNGFSAFIPIGDGKTIKLMHRLSFFRAYGCNVNKALGESPSNLEIHQDSFFPGDNAHPTCLHLNVRPRVRMLMEEFQAVVQDFFSIACCPSVEEAFDIQMHEYNWDIDPSSGGGSRIDRTLLAALHQFGTSSSSAPQQKLLCWFIYHKLKVFRLTIRDFLQDTKESRTLAAALDHFTTGDIHSSVYADSAKYALEKVLHHSPRYIEDPGCFDT